MVLMRKSWPRLDITLMLISPLWWGQSALFAEAGKNETRSFSETVQIHFPL